jgi:hypothetical protein
MGVHVAHLVLVAFCDAGDQVLDDGLYCSEGSDILAAAVVDFDLDNVRLGLYILVSMVVCGWCGATDDGECDGNVGQILDELASRALDGDDTTLDLDLDVVGDGDLLGRDNVPHLDGLESGVSAS